MRTGWIYSLSLDGVKHRYVGRTVHPRRRMQEHYGAAYKYDYRVHRWIRECADSGADIVMTLLEELPESELGRGEREWIEKLRVAGHNLLNSSVREHESLASDAIKKMRASLTGRQLSVEHRQRLSEIGKGRPLTQENRDVLSASALANPDGRRAGTHVRWHVKRGKVNPVCKYCTGELELGR